MYWCFNEPCQIHDSHSLVKISEIESDISFSFINLTKLDPYITHQDSSVHCPSWTKMTNVKDEHLLTQLLYVSNELITQCAISLVPLRNTESLIFGKVPSRSKASSSENSYGHDNYVSKQNTENRF